MRKFLIVLCCLAFAISLSAQERTGNLSGTVVDQEGNPLPGVTVTLTGTTIKAMSVQTNPEGKFRFLSLFPASDYVLKAELQGFKTRTESGVIINVGRNSDIKVVMEQGALEEQVTVIAQTPVVQAKKTQITHTVSYDMLQSLPSSRDPWVVLQLSPAILIDRENIGGVESGQQSSFMAKGTTTQEWTVDGMQTTDRNSGGSPGYYDFDAFEEMQISTGMLDVEHRDPAIVINLITRRGGNRTSLGGRFFWTNEKFQLKVSDARIKEIGVGGYNRANDIKDFGFNIGGPVIKDMVWWWIAYGIQQVKTFNILAPPWNIDDTYLNNYSAKLNFQLLPDNRTEVYFQAGDKRKDGRDSSASYPPGAKQMSKFYFGNPTYKFQTEQMFGDSLFVSLRYGKSNAGFGMFPMNDVSITAPRWYDYEKDLWNIRSWFYSDRPHPYGVAQIQFFNDNLFGTGTSHEIKLGAEINNNQRTYWGGNGGNFYIYDNYNVVTVDWDLNGTQDIVKNLPGAPNIKRIYIGNNDLQWYDGTDRQAFYFSDVVSAGRFNVTLGLRVDHAKPWIDPVTTRGLYSSGDTYMAEWQQNYASIALQNFTPDTIDKLSVFVPQKTRPYIEAKKLFWFFSPSLGINTDVFGDGKTILKLAYRLYPGGYLGTGYWSPLGSYNAINFWWADLNNDKKAHWSELYWANYSVSTRPVYRAFDNDGNFVGNTAREYGLHWSGWGTGASDFNNYGGFTQPTSYYDSNWKTSLTHEVLVSVEREIIRDFGVSLSYTWKRMGRFSWSQAYYPEAFFPGLNNHIRSQDDYMLAGNVPDSWTATDGKVLDPKEAKGKPWYVLKNIPETATTAYSYLTARPDYYQIFWGFDLVFNKRLSRRWMLNGSVTYQMQRNYYGKGYSMDPTGQWAYEGQIYGVGLGGGSGKISQNMFSRWMFKLQGLYQLPWDVSVSASLSAHEGGMVAESVGFQDTRLPNPRSNSNSMPSVTYDNRSRLPDVFTVNFKAEKAVRLGENSRVYFSADVFNVLNMDVVLRQYDKHLGTWRIHNNTYGVPSANQGKANEMMNPLLLRLGMRFQI